MRVMPPLFVVQQQRAQRLSEQLPSVHVPSPVLRPVRGWPLRSEVGVRLARRWRWSRSPYGAKAPVDSPARGCSCFAVSMVSPAYATRLSAEAPLQEIYETDFRGFSYGFRPGRGAHDALDALSVGIFRKRANWIPDADIRSYFDHLSHEWLLQFVQHRVADKRVLRLIQKWLKAGVREAGQWVETKEGTPQGAVVSPLLANVYLHYVFDLWVEQWRNRQARGDVIVVCDADDRAPRAQRAEKGPLCVTA